MMDGIILLWIDMRINQSKSDLFASLSNCYATHYVNDVTAIPQAVQRSIPLLLCFDYDYPSLPGLKALKRTKLQFPSLPILMLTEYHSGDLAVWALRSRVWDLLIKPVTLGEISQRIDLLSKLSAVRKIRDNGDTRSIHMLFSPIPTEVRFYNPAIESRTTLPAISFLKKNYCEKIRVEEVALLCRLRPIQFSKTFKQENGVTFREFLLTYRLNRAKEFLSNPHSSVTDVALSVGFDDLSYFADVFKRHVGISPSNFKRSKKR